MRFCPELATATSSQQPSVYALLNQQKQLLLLVSTYQHFWGGNSLDHVHPLLNKSLRWLLLEAAPKDQQSNRTFLAIQSSPRRFPFTQRASHAQNTQGTYSICQISFQPLTCPWHRCGHAAQPGCHCCSNRIPLFPMQPRVFVGVPFRTA